MKKIFLIFLVIGMFAQVQAIDFDIFGKDVVVGQIATLIDYGDNATSGFDGTYIVGETKNASYPYQIYLKIPNNVDITGKSFNIGFESCSWKWF